MHFKLSFLEVYERLRVIEVPIRAYDILEKEC